MPLSTLAWAQPTFYNLAPNADGSQLWFSSWFRMRGAEHHAHPKIFTWNESAGVQLYAQKPATIFGGGSLWGSETPYKLVATSVSAGGNVVASVSKRDCHFGTPCGTEIELYGSEIRIAGRGPLEFKGAASLSPNGRFAYLNTSRFTVVAYPAITLVDLLTGAEVEFEGRRFDLPNRHRVANDGSVLLDNILRLPNGTTRELDFTRFNPRITMLNDAATRVVYATGYGGVGSAQLLLVADDSRILRIGVHIRRTTEIVPATPTLRVPYPYEGPTNIVAGSVYTLTMAEGLPPISNLRLSGVEQHILSAGSDHIAFQAVANEDTSAGWLELVFAEQSDSPFVSSALWGHPTEPTPYAPFWYRRPDRSIVAMHQDYRSEITFENPARPTEIVQLYGSGFGPVTPPVDTGQPAPASPLSSVAEPFACRTRSRPNSAISISDVAGR